MGKNYEEDDNLSPDQPIDEVARNLMQTIHAKGRGFVLGVTKTQEDAEGTTKIEVVESLRPHDEYEPPAAYRAHAIKDTESFVGYATRYGDSKASLILFSDAGAMLSLNEQVEKGDRELVWMSFDESDDWKEWTNALKAGSNHRDLLRFLMAHEHNLVEPAVLKAMQSMKMNSTVNVESDVKDDGETVGIVMKTSAGEELKRFPKSFYIHLPILQQDVAAENQSEKLARISLEVVMPDQPMKGPTFLLHCSTWRQIKQVRINEEGERIREGLPGWTVVQGEHKTKPRRLIA